jgi:protein-S-isoprenylcysteine O-methyltransferase Ste14
VGRIRNRGDGQFSENIGVVLLCLVPCFAFGCIASMFEFGRWTEVLTWFAGFAAVLGLVGWWLVYAPDRCRRRARKVEVSHASE